MKVTIDRIEGDIAVLKTKDDAINIPKKYLPLECKENDVLNLIITNEKEESNNNKQEAKNILNEILDSNSM